MYSCKIGCIGKKEVLFGQNGFNLEKLLYSGNSDCIRAKVDVFGKKWLYSGKNGCIRAKVFVFRQNSCIQAKVVVFGQKGLYSGKVVVFEQSGCNREN